MHCCHIPRARNAVADWLTNLPRVLGRDVTMQEVWPDARVGVDPPWPASAAT